MKINLAAQDKFENRHHGKTSDAQSKMLSTIGVDSLETLINQTVPASIRLPKALQLPAAQSEVDFLTNFKKLAQKNQIFKSYIGAGYYDTIVPNVILRNILENPAWYTAYTPYQAEIAQGRLEMLLNFQTLILDLTGMEIANASLLDEATAAAEAMTMLHSLRSAEKKNAETFFVSELCHPQTIDVVIGRAKPLNITVVVGNHETIDLTKGEIFGMLLQYPATNGDVYDYSALIATAHELNIFSVVAADLLSLTLLKSPGEMGADAVVGSAQRLGVPMGYGGPHAGYFATKEGFKRQMPGRIIGVSVDAQGNRALRMALQTREQHIRREKATSNICTAQVLLSVMASAYAVYHGAEGLTNIASKIHGLTQVFAKNLEKIDGYQIKTSRYFDTITIASKHTSTLKTIAEKKKCNFRYYANGDISLSFDERKTLADVNELLEIFAEAAQQSPQKNTLSTEITIDFGGNLNRQTKFLTHPVFNSYHTEHEMLRYLKSLETKDLSLVHSMISLGSCTMKLNATVEMIPVTWAEIGNIHPFAPEKQAKGFQEITKNLNDWLCEITGFAAMSLQPNSGAQGEYAGLMVIRAYHQKRGNEHRNIALIPSSAHGTNPASAVMAGMKVVVVKCDERGNIDVADLQAKASEYADSLACLMVTYPSTHGVFEESIKEICSIIHQNGGQVYMDGANMNAQVGLTSPATIGADVCHLNLHKTFCIPHGGGGPGVGPIGVAKHLVEFLPSTKSPLDATKSQSQAIHSISAAPYGSASILPISYAYIALMGGEGLTNATKNAILNANYMKSRLEAHYPVLYAGSQGRCAHEMILDCRPFKQSAGIEVEDIAKRLMDYGFHAPTVSFPVAGTLMIEPTESESKAELDRFCDAMIAIRQEIEEIEKGVYERTNNVLKNAPHTASVVMADQWDKSYTREKAAYPLPFVKANKFWASVSRVDGAYGDRNLVCSCLPIEEYA